MRGDVAVRLELHVAGRIEDYALIGDMQTAALVCGTARWTGCACPASTPMPFFAGPAGAPRSTAFWRLGPAHAEDAEPPTATRAATAATR
ncbi:hypothetical protein GCM10023238_02990 [Streptomyces heliomycini]